MRRKQDQTKKGSFIPEATGYFLTLCGTTSAQVIALKFFGPGFSTQEFFLNQRTALGLCASLSISLEPGEVHLATQRLESWLRLQPRIRVPLEVLPGKLKEQNCSD